MSFDGSGVYSLTYTWATEAASPPIAISKLDTEFAGIAAGLSLCILRNGNGKPTANIEWNAQKITNLGNATADADALNRVTADGRYVRAGGDETITGTWSFDVTPTVDGDALWHAGNDGAGSGLDADTLDGLQASAFVQVLNGSFTATLASASSGGTVYVTGTAYWSKIGNLVTLTLPATFKAAALSGNNYAFVRDLPAAIRSACAIQQTVSVPIEDENTYLTGLLEIFTGSVDYMRLYTAGGTYGFAGTVPGFYAGATFTYRVSD